MTTSILESIPPEILEQIAYHVAVDSFLGPPSNIISLLSISRRMYSCLSPSSNTCLYAKIFSHKFDLLAAMRRIGSERLSTAVLTQELRRRCVLLKRIRSRMDACTDEQHIIRDDDTLHDILIHAYLWMLENEGKNERQLREYARIDLWLNDYWFNLRGSSGAKRYIGLDLWPVQTRHAILAMWLFWFTLKPEEYSREDDTSWKAMDVLKVFALGAHRFYLASPSWLDFIPQSYTKDLSEVTYYSEQLLLKPPPLAVPAILSFITLVNQLQEQTDYSTPFAPMDASMPRSSGSMEWEREWGRCYSLGQPTLDKFLTDSFAPGSLEGVWEGMFTYTEFAAYVALLQGAPPPLLQRSLVVRHRQTWKLREHHLISSDPSHNAEPLPAGDPLRSYFPTGTSIREHDWGVEVKQPYKDPVHYQRAAKNSPSRSEIGKTNVIDIIITGEGHSAWGQFNLVGRIRPCDGFISLSKDYIDGDRGKWLYRGYLVGNTNGNLAGRWRDTLSPVSVPGYEGCFTMTRRR
ncbi:hypothetical protein Moror_14547 [Moniliophthora roreri MCA 2997]|uniref:F-box domain-containing protein n=1 Tax=Moniliophthora roreri (strain MCA 2997) TaxID=1381753 RepID=V2YNM6_MONRO|nr:hypothetical protein Moror_14547 [Moniliophthora roreri MCA 2997]